MSNTFNIEHILTEKDRWDFTKWNKRTIPFTLDDYAVIEYTYKDFRVDVVHSYPTKYYLYRGEKNLNFPFHKSSRQLKRFLRDKDNNFWDDE